MIIGGIFVLLGLLTMIINTPRAVQEVLTNGIPASYSILVTTIVVMFWLYSFFGFGFSLKLTILYILILTFFWLLSFKYLRKN